MAASTLALMAGLAGLTLLCLALGARSLGKQLHVLRRMEALSDAARGGGWPAGLGRLARRILVFGAADQREIEEKLALAGHYGPQGVAVFAVARMAASFAAGGLVAKGLMMAGRWTGTAPYLAVAAGAATFVMSKQAIGWMAARRRRKVEAELPFFIDILAMMLNSGVSLDQAFRTLAQVQRCGAPLTRRTVEALVADITRGMPYETALDRWTERLGIGGARELASLFKRNLAQGTELGGGLAALGRELTERRIAAAREAIGRKSAQMAVITLLFFLPALFIVLAGPAFVTLKGAFSGPSQ